MKIEFLTDTFLTPIRELVYVKSLASVLWYIRELVCAPNLLSRSFVSFLYEFLPEISAFAGSTTFASSHSSFLDLGVRAKRELSPDSLSFSTDKLSQIRFGSLRTPFIGVVYMF
jgi:hypothetical protein